MEFQNQYRQRKKRIKLAKESMERLGNIALPQPEALVSNDRLGHFQRPRDPQRPPSGQALGTGPEQSNASFERSRPPDRSGDVNWKTWIQEANRRRAEIEKESNSNRKGQKKGK